MAKQLDIFDGLAMNLAEGLKRVVGAPGLTPTREMRAQEKRARARAAKPSIDQRFAEFHTANPHVFDELLRLARTRLAAGAKRIGLKALWEELRGHLQVTDPATYKLNNDFTALYARMLVRVDPRLETVIEMRRRKRGD